MAFFYHFIARVKIDGAEEVELVHVKNTGRCRELLLPGAEVILEDCIEKNPNRKTRYEAISQITGDRVETLKVNYHYAKEKIKEYIVNN